MRKTGSLLILAVGILCGLNVAEPHPEEKGISLHNALRLKATAPFIRPRVSSRARVRIVSASEAPIPKPKPVLLEVLDQPDILEEDRIFLDKVFRALPALCRDHLEHVIVRYDPNAERGQATATTMLLRGPLSTLSPKKKMEMIGVITHECGHIISLNALAGIPSDGMSEFPDGHIPTYNGAAARFYGISWKNSEEMARSAKSGDFVSGYAKENPFEDIAETIAYYVLQRTAFEERAERNSILALKLQWAETYINDPLFRAPLSTGWDGRFPWDITKLPHALTL